MGIPGVVQNGVSGESDFDKLSHLPLADYLSDKWGRPVLAGNDVNCAALGYYHHQKEERAESLAYLYYPREGNAGAGIVINGRVIHGVSDFAGKSLICPSFRTAKCRDRFRKTALHSESWWSIRS